MTPYGVIGWERAKRTNRIHGIHIQPLGLVQPNSFKSNTNNTEIIMMAIIEQGELPLITTQPYT